MHYILYRSHGAVAITVSSAMQNFTQGYGITKKAKSSRMVEWNAIVSVYINKTIFFEENMDKT